MWVVLLAFCEPVMDLFDQSQLNGTMTVSVPGKMRLHCIGNLYFYILINHSSIFIDLALTFLQQRNPRVTFQLTTNKSVWTFLIIDQTTKRLLNFSTSLISRWVQAVYKNFPE